MSKQLILVKGVSLKEFDYISAIIKEKLAAGETHICVYSPLLEVEIDIIELPDTEDKPMIIHNSYMGMQPLELRAIVAQTIMEVLKEVKGKLNE